MGEYLMNPFQSFILQISTEWLLGLVQEGTDDTKMKITQSYSYWI